MADFAFARLRAESLYAVCHPDNGAPIKVMEKLGMRYRGLEDWYSQKVATYAITAEEWHRARVRDPSQSSQAQVADGRDHRPAVGGPSSVVLDGPRSRCFGSVEKIRFAPLTDWTAEVEKRK
jgi:hypothetical protein